VVVIKHEAIPGYMAAMTMPFSYRDNRQTNGLKPGDVVTFRLLATEDDGWIENVVRIGSTNLPAPARDPLRKVRIVDPLAVGDPAPDYPFTNALGRTVRLSEFKGDAVALTFFYTRCPYPAFCPRMTDNFAQVDRVLTQEGNSFTNWHLISLSFDPENDSLAVLRSYAESHHADPARWTFATGSQIDIDAITEQFGLETPRDGDFFDHNLRTVVIDPRGRVARIFQGNTWKPAELVDALRQAAETRGP
jgi:protein SCO1/2